MRYSWECGWPLLRICHNDFWFCGILTDRLVSKIFWRHCLDGRSRTFAWFLQKLQWFNKNTQFSIYSIWNIYSTSKTLPIQKKIKSDWREVLSVDYLNSINCWTKLEELQKVIPYHSKKYKQIILNASSPFSSIVAHDLSFATSFIVAALFLMVKASRPMTPIFDSVDGRTNWWKRNYQSNYFQNKRKKSVDLIR